MSDHLKAGYFAKIQQWMRQWVENPQEHSATLTQLHKDVDGLFNKVETVRAGLMQVELNLAAQNGDVKKKMSDHLKAGYIAEFQQRLKQWMENPQKHSATLTQLYKDIDGLSKDVVRVRVDLPQVERHLAAQNVAPEQQDPQEHSAILTRLHEDIDGLSNYIETVRMGLLQVELDLAAQKGEKQE